MEGAGSAQKAPVPFPPGEGFRLACQFWPLSESPLCLFTAVTVRGSGVGGAGEKKKRKKSKAEKGEKEKPQLLESARL